MKVGILTGGGDCPGLNAVIRAVTLALIHQDRARVTGIRRGYLGLITQETMPLDAGAVERDEARAWLRQPGHALGRTRGRGAEGLADGLARQAQE